MNTYYILKMAGFGAALAALGTDVSLGCGDSEDNASDPDSDSDTDSNTDSDSDSDGYTDTELPETCEGGRLDPDTGLCWQNPGTYVMTFWDSAVSICNTLILGGQNDWFLPGRDDFVALFDGCDEIALNGDCSDSGRLGYCDSCALSEKCSALFGDDEKQYWTSDEGGFESVWAVGFSLSDGRSRFACDTGDFYSSYIRCIRRVFPVDAGVDGGE